MGAQVQKSALAEPETGIRFHGAFLAVALFVAAEFGADVEAGIGRAQLEIQHAGNGVGTVLGGGAVAQYLHRFDGDGGNAADVHAVGPEGAEAQHRTAMPTLAVEQDQRVVRIEAAQFGRAHERRAIGNRLSFDVERRHDGLHHIDQVRGVDAVDVVGVEHIHRHRRIGHRARLAARADGDDDLIHRFEVRRRWRRGFLSAAAYGESERQSSADAWRHGCVSFHSFVHLHQARSLLPVVMLAALSLATLAKG